MKMSGVYVPDRRIILVAGPCAAETPEQTLGMAYRVSLVRDAVRPFGIDMMYRAGAWKPRTQCYNDHNGEGVFEGKREEGLGWLNEAGNSWKLPIVTECMSEQDVRHFGRGRYITPDRGDWIQVGARNSQNYALLYAIGSTDLGVLLKNPQHGVDPKEAVGSLQRLCDPTRGNNPTRVYCVRGQKKFIDPDGEGNGEYAELMARIMGRDTQHPDARNFNNIGAINALRRESYFTRDGMLLGYDPSHAFGGNNDAVRRRIGDSAIEAVTEYGYDVVELEVHDWSASALVDGDQALLTTTRNVDWSQTNAGQGPGVKPNAGREPDVMPLTLVDIAGSLIDYQADRMGIGADDSRIVAAKGSLAELRWDM